MDDARCPARDHNGFDCVLDDGHPGGHTASRVVVSWVDETSPPPDGPVAEVVPSEPRGRTWPLFILGAGTSIGLFMLALAWMDSPLRSPVGVESGLLVLITEGGIAAGIVAALVRPTRRGYAVIALGASLPLLLGGPYALLAIPVALLLLACGFVPTVLIRGALTTPEATISPFDSLDYALVIAAGLIPLGVVALQLLGGPTFVVTGLVAFPLLGFSAARWGSGLGRRFLALCLMAGALPAGLLLSIQVAGLEFEEYGPETRAWLVETGRNLDALFAVRVLIELPLVVAVMAGLAAGTAILGYALGQRSRSATGRWASAS